MREQYGTHSNTPFEDFVWQLTLDTSNLDDEAGTVEYGPGWYARLGKRVVSQDDRGFVYLWKYPTEQDAADFMADIHEEYSRLDREDQLTAIVDATGLGRLFA